MQSTDIPKLFKKYESVLDDGLSFVLFKNHVAIAEVT